MMWILLLMLGVALGQEEVGSGLGDRILRTENECARLYTLNEHWNSSKYNDRAVLYVDLFFLCEESLAEDKLKYIEKNHIDLSKYPGEHFPVTTSKGQTDFIDKPPVKPKDEIDLPIKNKIKSYLKRFGGKLNPMYKLSEIQSKLSQEIVDKQTSCELKAIMVNKHPEVPAMSDEHTKCMDELNCLKEKFMEEHGFTLEKYPDYFPIMYKGRGTMINSPPESDGTSLCVNPVHADNYKTELKKWDITKKLQNIEKTAEGKIDNMQDAGIELIKRLKEIGIRAGAPLMTKQQLDTLMDNVESITVVEDDGTESKDQPKIDFKTIRQSATQMTDKLHDLENGGKNILINKLDKLNEIRPDMGSLTRIASKLDNVKTSEANRIKMAVKKTMKGLSDTEVHLKKKSEPVLVELKQSISLANDAEKQAALKLKHGSFVVVDKLKSKMHTDLQNQSPGNSGENDEEHPGGWLGEYAHAELEKIRKADVHTLLAKFGHGEGGVDMLSDKRFLELLNNMKRDINEKAKTMNINSKEVKQAASVVKGVLYSVLNAAKHGRGPAKGMTNNEIRDAKFMVNQMVDFATAEIFPDEEVESEEDDESISKEALKGASAPTVTPTAVNHAYSTDVPKVIDLTRGDQDGDEFPLNSDNHKTEVPKPIVENEKVSNGSGDKVKVPVEDKFETLV